MSIISEPKGVFENDQRKDVEQVLSFQNMKVRFFSMKNEDMGRFLRKKSSVVYRSRHHFKIMELFLRKLLMPSFFYRKKLTFMFWKLRTCPAFTVLKNSHQFSGVVGGGANGRKPPPPFGPKKYEVIHFLNKKIREIGLKICIFAYEVG